MLPECTWYCKDTYATKFRINLQIINNEMMILICLISRDIMLHQFISSHKFKICVVYLRMLSRMKAAYIFYFQYSFLEIRIINSQSKRAMYVLCAQSHGYIFSSRQNSGLIPYMTYTIYCSTRAYLPKLKLAPVP